MEQFQNHELEYVVDDYYDITDFEDDNVSRRSGSSSFDDDSANSDFEDDFELVIKFVSYFRQNFYLFQLILWQKMWFLSRIEIFLLNNRASRKPTRRL